jgi:LuxR family maltose regulon positive regulatory protein
VEIRSEDLNFTEDEVSELVEQNNPTGLSFEQNTSLAKRTEGWITGIKLTALSAQKIAANKHANDLSEFINDFGGDDRYVMDYLAEEVFRPQPDVVQEFLLKTSITKRMNDSLCEAVIKNGNGHNGNGTNGRFSTSREILEYLDMQNLFIIPLDTRRNWYRYHGLFRDFLRWQLQKSVSDEEIACLYRQASLWTEEHGLTAEAIEYALAGRDYPRVVYLLDQYGLHLLAEALLSFDKRWIEALPKHLIESNPMLHVLPVVAQLAKGETLSENTEAHLKAAELYLSQKGKIKIKSHPARYTAYSGHLSMIRASQGRTE